MNKHIEFTYTNHIAHITLNKPEKHNSLNYDDINALISILGEINDNHNLRCMILSAKGNKTFCSGASFEHIKEGTLRGDAFSTLAQRIHNLRIPSICVLNGNVYGGGVELALACDFRLGLLRSMLQVPVAKLGLCYSTFGLNLYLQKLGLQTSKRILLCAESLSADELYQLGFYEQLFESYKEALHHANTLANNMSHLAPLAVENMRKTLHDISSNSLDLSNAIKRESQCADSKDRREGFTAILEKRSAVFTRD